MWIVGKKHIINEIDKISDNNKVDRDYESLKTCIIQIV